MMRVAHKKKIYHRTYKFLPTYKYNNIIMLIRVNVSVSRQYGIL